MQEIRSNEHYMSEGPLMQWQRIEELKEMKRKLSMANERGIAKISAAPAEVETKSCYSCELLHRKHEPGLIRRV